MEPKLPADEDTNLFFDDVVAKLETDSGFFHDKATALVREFYVSITNKEYCKKIGVGLHDDDMFFHEGAVVLL